MNVLEQIKEGSSRKNVGSVERAISAAAGLVALGYALRGRRGRVAALLGGASLLQRGATGYCTLYKAMGVDRTSSPTPESADFPRRIANG